MKSEKILCAIGQIDDVLIEDAVIQAAQKKKPFYRKPAFCRAAAIAACFVAVVGLLLVILPQIQAPVGTQEQTNGMIGAPDQGVVFDSPDKVNFDSLDKVNYYAGLKLINQLGVGVFAQKAISENGYSLKLLNQTSVRQEPHPAAGNDDDVIRIDRHPDDISNLPLRITTTIYFQLNVTEQDEFLPSKVGIGTVDVVITDLHIGITPFAMVTFKNGERYFSCLTESRELVDGKNMFWTHLYIDGFKLCKDITAGTHFDVVYSAQLQKITSISWGPYCSVPTEAPVYPIAIVPESTKVADITYEFTLLDLAEYYNGSPEAPQKQSGC